jgi:type III pantothenate kinase
MIKPTHIFAIDIGNTRIKWVLFKAADAALFDALSTKNVTVFDRYIQVQSMMISHGNCLHADLASHNLPIEAKAKSTQVVVSNVASEALLNTVIAKLIPQTNVQLFISDAFSCGIQNHYDNPQQLGTDRWAALIAAKHLQQSDCVVVNAGTAVTIDVLQTDISNTAGEKLNDLWQTHTETNAHFLGGLILPGLRLMQTSLHQNTATLCAKSHAPNHTQTKDFIAKNTYNAISKGAMTAICSSILQIAEQVKLQTNNTPAIILSGGDAVTISQALTKMLESHHNSQALTIQSIPNAPITIEHLVLIGLFFGNHQAINLKKSFTLNTL